MTREAVIVLMQRRTAALNAHDVPALGRGDEVGEMAQAVLAFKEAAIQKRALEAQTAEQRQAVEAVLRDIG